MITSDRRPNFLIILSDQHSPHIAGCYGDPVVRTPHLDALAARGVRFTDAYCASPLCGPSRMSLMTGRLPSHTRAYTNECALAQDIPTFAHSLGAAGYEVTLAGRMHFRGADQLHGFARRLAGDVTPTWYGAPGPEMGDLAGANGQTRIAVENAGPGLTNYQHYDRLVTDAAVAYLRQRPAGPAHQGGIEDNRAAPFCLVVGYVLPHCPFVAPQPLFDYYFECVPPPHSAPTHCDPNGRAIHPQVERWMKRRGLWEPVDEQTIRTARAAYYGLVEMVDAQVGQLLDALAARADADNTVVIYLSDHGEMAGEHGLWWKSTFYRASVNVPLIASWPGHFQENAAVTTPVSLVDLAPTLAALAQGPPLPHIDGMSLVPLLTGAQAPHLAERDILAELIAPVPHGALGTWSDPPTRMVRRGPWKLVYYHDSGVQLFNLADDPHEQHDRAADLDCRAILVELTARAQQDWHPQAMLAELEERQATQALLAQWFQAVQPPDPYHTPLPATYNQLGYRPPQIRLPQEPLHSSPQHSSPQQSSPQYRSPQHSSPPSKPFQRPQG